MCGSYLEPFFVKSLRRVLDQIRDQKLREDVDRLHRAHMCWVSQQHMFGFVADGTELMSSFDVPRHGERRRVTMRQNLLMANSRFDMRLRSMLPGYTPHKYTTVPSNIAELFAPHEPGRGPKTTPTNGYFAQAA